MDSLRDAQVISQVLFRMPRAWTAFLMSRLPETEAVCVGNELRVSGPTKELSFPEAKGLVSV